MPNYKRDNRKKVNYLCYVVRKLLLTYLGVYPKIDRDSYAYKRINTPGNLLLNCIVNYGTIQKRASLKIDTEYKFNLDKSKSDIDSLVNSSNLHTVFDSRILDKIVKSFGSVVWNWYFWTTRNCSRFESELYVRNTFTYTKTCNSSSPRFQSHGPRKLHGSQWFVCPTESPDGGNTGIINHLTIISDITNKSSDILRTVLQDLDVLFLDELTIVIYQLY